MLRILLFSLFFLVTGVLPSYGGTPLDTETFSKIPILHQGRIKPMDSFAKALIKPLTGSNQGAIPHLITMLFNPAKAEHDQIIKASHPDSIAFLDLKKRHSRRYSYQELAQAFKKKEETIQALLAIPSPQLTPGQKEIVHLYTHILTMRDILGSLVLYAPIANIAWDNIPQNLKPKKIDFASYVDLIPFKDRIFHAALEIAHNKGVDLSKYTEEEKAIARLSLALSEIEKPIFYSQQYKVLDEQSPWDFIRTQAKPPTSFTLWQDAMIAYHASDWHRWNTAIGKIYQNTPPTTRVMVEHWYNQLDPFYLSAILCALTLIFSAFYSLKNQLDMPIALLILLSLATLLQFIGLIMRMYILNRPPVSTLYESILFVGLVGLLYGVIMGYKDRQNIIAIVMSAFLGIILYLLAYFNDQSGDTFMMLTAVLNTNFWLATHVLTITTGYGFCLITSGLAHYSLLKEPKDFMPQVQKTALWSLFLCSLGTILGGIWADQSWGRFWGWDPKENGALLIVLWLVWLLHGKISQHFNTVYFMAGMAYLSVIVMLSWFGVNLLSIGLHAYGFTSAALWWLVSFIIFETALVGFLVQRQRVR